MGYMDNKILGGVMILLAVLVGLLVYSFDVHINDQASASCSCTEIQNGGVCPHQTSSMWPIHLGIAIIGVIGALGIYLVVFDKSQKKIVSFISEQKEEQTSEEKFSILLKALSADEQKIVRAVKEQDGITQQTLRIRTDMHKSKLSILLDGLEKKGLIKRVPKGKTNKVHLRIAL
jgi:hypothetical protein